MNDHSSSHFVSWLIHRQTLLGMEGANALADSAGVSKAIIDKMLGAGSLRGIGRSARSALARSLRITVRDLESIASGQIEWINDAQQVDWDRHTPDSMRAVAPASQPRLYEARWCTPAHGVPLVGNLVEGGLAQFFETNPSDATERLPVRYSGAPDAFALMATCPIESYPAGAALVFRALPPGQLENGQMALLCGAEGIVDGMVCQVMTREQQTLKIKSTLNKEVDVPLETVLRAAVVLAAHLSGVERADV